MALDLGDDRLGKAVNQLEEVAEVRGVLEVLVKVELLEPLEVIQVCACAECFAVCLEYDDFDLGTLFGFEEGLDEFADELKVEGVALVGPVEGDVGDAVADLVLGEFEVFHNDGGKIRKD